MSRILIAWELGGNYGHLMSCLAIAQALRKHRHTVMFAVRDTRTAAELLPTAGFSFLQAPLSTRKARLSRPPANYSELLLGEGYADAQGLLGMVRGWRSLIQSTCADLVLADSAPTALIASHSLGRPCVALGNGFGVPPNVSPLPSIRPWEDIADSRLAHADETINASIADVMTTVGSKYSPTLVELYRNACLNIFSELDPFGPREGCNYLGPIYAFAKTKTVTWPVRHKLKILAYLRPDMAGFTQLLAALSANDADKICVIPGLRAEHVNQFSSDRLRISAEPLALENLLSKADALVSYGGSGIVSLSLLAGVPMLIVPRYVEQYLTAKRAECMGTAVVMETNRSRENFDQSLRKVLGETIYRSNAQAFARRYTDFDPQHSIERTVSATEQIVQQYGTSSPAVVR